MKIEYEATREPVRGKHSSRLRLDAPQRVYNIQTDTKDGTLDVFSMISANTRGVNHRGTNAEIETQDIRKIAKMLIAHADEMGLPDE